ncbi:hypothetical protein CM15mP43_10230 [bacterium]|nr:MAG: hypothetical protein CM15mP43_10230 [bacterium]
MFYGITSGIVSSKKYEFNHVIKDIQTLNKMAINSELHTTAVSANAYLQIQDKYRIMDWASMGDNYGPIVVAKDKIKISSETKLGYPENLLLHSYF